MTATASASVGAPAAGRDEGRGAATTATSPPPPTYVYVGERRNGVSVAGRTHEAPSTLARRLFDRRWRWLSVHVEGDDENEVAAIVAHPDTGRRVWWSE